jgi:hypothetical protein
MRKESSTNILIAGTLACGAITRTGQRRDIAVAVGTTCIVAVPERNTPTALRFLQGAGFGIVIHTGQSSATSVTPKTLAVPSRTRPTVRLSYAALRFARFANGDGALPALIAAQRFLAAAAIAFRPAALNLRLRQTGCCTFSVGANDAGFRPDPGGRPRRLPGEPPRASMARLRRSRSAIIKAKM